jgi:histidinol-phosphate aminotransferase
MRSPLKPAFDEVATITPYKGGDVFPPDFQRLIPLCSNENPFGFSPKVRLAMEGLLETVSAYPSSSHALLRQALADFHGFDPDWIVCGNGSEELLHLAARLFLKPGDEIILPRFAFGVFKIAGMSCGASIKWAERNDNLELTASSILSAITPRTKMLMIDHPGNPIGNFLPKVELRKLLENVGDSIAVILDAAYGEYLAEEETYTDGTPWVKEFPNLIVTHTFSKVYGLAGIRVGWLTAQPEVCKLLNTIRQPFNMNVFGQMAAVQALKDQDFVQRVVGHAHSERERVAQELSKMGFSLLPHCSNFIVFEGGPRAEHIYNHLGRKGIIIRPMDGYGLINHLRVSIGSTEQMGAFLEALGEA